jgi:hypothetical protein
VVCALVMPAASIAAEENWGAWADDGGVNIYEFLSSNQFKFSDIKKVMIQRQGLAGNLVQNIPGVGEPRRHYIQERRTLTGAWETGEKICAGQDPESATPKQGNLKIYAGTVECCMEVKRVGSMLVLRALSRTTGGKDDQPQVCYGRALKPYAAQ